MKNKGTKVNKGIFTNPEIQVINLDELEAIQAVAGSCKCHCNCRSR